MNWPTRPTERLEILRAHDHFRNWQTLEDERVCVLCDRRFNGYEILISLVGDEWELHCPTANCKSGVHQWVYPGKPLISEATYEDWWHALGSRDASEGIDDATGTPSPQPV